MVVLAGVSFIDGKRAAQASSLCAGPFVHADSPSVFFGSDASVPMVTKLGKKKQTESSKNVSSTLHSDVREFINLTHIAAAGIHMPTRAMSISNRRERQITHSAIPCEMHVAIARPNK
jgi:hypothetical protein